jgi:hypothetical protein
MKKPKYPKNTDAPVECRHPPESLYSYSIIEDGKRDMVVACKLWQNQNSVL